MNLSSQIIAIASLLVVLLVTKLITTLFKIELKPVKYSTIDGLRGYLAFFVFLHHSAVYFFLLTERRWAVPPSNLFTHFGQTSVALFFMITAFLFFNKLIEARANPINWTHFFISRVMRLYPLYILALALVITAVFIMSDFSFTEPFLNIAKELKQWLLFAIFDSPNINGYNETNSILASVIWSLKYEWLFYLALPLLGLIFFKQKFAPIAIILSACLFYIIYFYSPIDSIHFYSFLGGIIAAFLSKNEKFIKISQHRVSSVICLVCLFVTIYFYETAYQIIPLSLLSIAFMLIAGGNTLFGILTLNVSRQLGQLSYSIYLLHPLALFYLYRISIDFEVANKFSAEKFWLINAGLAVLLIITCFITYYFIEYPSIRLSGKIAKKITGTIHQGLAYSYKKVRPQKD